MNESSSELHVTRLFDAPAEVVWNAWTTPEQIAQWFAPVIMEVRELDVRPGGHFRFADPSDKDSGEYTGTYIAVEPFEELSFEVLDYSLNDDPAGTPAGFKIKFENVGEKTRLTLTSIPPEDSYDESTYNAWSGCFDRMAHVIQQ